MDQGTYLVNEDKQSCRSSMGHSMLTCSIILPSIIIELCSRNENEVKIWIRGHNKKINISRVAILVPTICVDLFYSPTKYH